MRAANGCMVLHVDLFVRSMTRSLGFYCEKLGFSVVDDTILRGPIVHAISHGLYNEVRLVLLRVSSLGAMIELLEFQNDDTTSADKKSGELLSSAVSILVPDLSAHISRAECLGVYPVTEVFTVDLPQRGRCRVVFYSDPDENRLEFVQACPIAAPGK